MSFDDAVFAVDGDTREVAHMLVGARQLVEEGGLAAVLLSGEGEGELGAFGQRGLVGLVVVNACLTQARVGVVVGEGGDIQLVEVVAFFFALAVVAGLHFDEGGIGFAKGEGIAVDHHLHRVAQGRVFHDFDGRIGDKAHVEEMLPALAFASHGLDTCGLSYFEFIEGCHWMLLFDAAKIQRQSLPYYPHL